MSASSFVAPACRKMSLPTTTVQELVKSSTVPDNYIAFPKSDANNASLVLPYVDTPVVDLQLLLDVSSPLAKQELINLRDALSTWGCIQLVNHGIASSLMDQLHCVGKQFFGLPAEEKQKYSRTCDFFEGYGNDPVCEGHTINWNDRLHLRIEPAARRNFKFWPDIVPNFRKTLDEYSIELRRVLETMLKVVAKLINLDENAFLNQYGEDGEFFTRFNYYPPCPNPDQVIGLKAHSDATLLTILLQDKDVEGLQLLKDDQWYKVPVIPDALVVNVGDELEILSNGILKSSTHQVVTNKEKARMSVAATSSVNHCKPIGPLPELIDAGMPRLYKNVDDYMRLFLEKMSMGESAIDAVKIKPCCEV